MSRNARHWAGVTNSLVGPERGPHVVPSVEKGVNQACTEGILAGCRVVDVKIDFYDGKMHRWTRKTSRFQIAGYFCVQGGVHRRASCLLEPITTLRFTFRTIAWASVGDLSSRRGRIQALKRRRFPGDQGAGSGEGPLSLFQQSPFTDGWARRCIRRFSAIYEEMPRDAAEKVIEEAKKRKAAAESH